MVTLTWRFVRQLLLKCPELADNGQWVILPENSANFALAEQNDMLLNG
jgi:hypothetical protein